MLFAYILVVAFFATTHASVSGYIGTPERHKLLEALMRAFVNLQEGDLNTIYYGAKGFTLLNESIPRVSKMDSCSHLQRYYKSASPPEPTFLAVSAWSLLNCSGTLRTGDLHSRHTIEFMKQAIGESKTTIDVRYALQTLQFLKEPISNPLGIAHHIKSLLKADDSLLSIGHGLHAARVLEHFGDFILDHVEEIVVQADEVDGRMLQWEGGLTITGLLLTGLLNLPKAKPFTQLHTDKFATYLLSRRSVQTPRGALALVESAIALSSSEMFPVSVTIIGSAQITPDNPELKVRISSLFGKSLKAPPTIVTAQSATRIADDVVVLSKQPLLVTEEPTVFKLPLRLEPGQYRMALSAGKHSASLIVRVLGPLILHSLDIGLGDADGASAPRITTLAFRSELQTTLQADSTHSLILKFSLSRMAQQVFLRLYSGKREVIFIAEKDINLLYKINVNLASEISYSGLFDMELIIGDALVSNPIRWRVGAVHINLPTPEPIKVIKTVRKQEIKHVFRKPEARPPQLVSSLFTSLAAAPLLLLLILWAKIGINLKNMSLSSLPFHIGLGSILVLFGLFWWRYDMFVTCAWLIPLGGITFLSGNQLLNKIAKQRK